MFIELDTGGIHKIWSFRGTLHLHSKDDVSPIINIVKNEWHTRLGRYMTSVFGDTTRKNIKETTCHLILILWSAGTL